MMKSRKKVGIYIDYTIRIPNFKQTYSIFKTSLFKDNYGIEKIKEEEDIDNNLLDTITFYWPTQLNDPKIKMFYATQDIEKINDKEVELDFKTYFYNDEHYKRFLDEYSYNLYSDCEIASKKDIDIINIAQANLFDIVLIDNVISSRKISTTFYFLAKNRLFPQSLLFLYENQELNRDSYFAIWNPKENKEQRNDDIKNDFLDWFKDLEIKSKEDKQ